MFTTRIRRLQPAPVAAPAAGDEGPADEEAPCGCGWFDSSHELQSGLMVTEHLSADDVASELPLGDWLGLHLRGWSESRSEMSCGA